MTKKRIDEAVPPAAPAPTPAAKPAPMRHIGQDFASAKKTIGMMLTKLGNAFQEYEQRMGRLNMALQQKIGPLGAGATSAQERIAQLEQDYEELQKSSQEQLQQAERTIADLRQQLKAAQSAGATDGERLRIAQDEIRGLEQTVKDKSSAVENLMARLEKARGRLQAGAAAHDTDRQAFAKAMDVYQAKIEELKQANAELQQTAEEAVEKFNKLLGGVTRPTPEHKKHYGDFDLLEHLAKAKKKDKKNAADW
jgi:chromosome segregation ATPase